MKKFNNRMILLLMGSSIILLLILQFFWLKGSYEKAHLDLHRESNMLFRNTILGLRDSVLVKNIQTFPGDSLSMMKEKKLHSPPDSLFHFFGAQEKSASIQVFISYDVSDQDSISTVLRPIVSKFQNGNPGRQNRFILRLGPDTLNLDTVNLVYSSTLHKAGIDLPFKIKLFTDEHPAFVNRNRPVEINEPEERHRRNRFFGDSMRTDFVHIGPAHRYSASFGKIQGFVFKAITPQILFSLFLTLITVTAFVILYRSIRSQQRLMELKNDFISNMTHELKTPIATVSVALEALRNFKGMDNPTLTNEYLEIAQHELNRLTLLTDKVLKTSHFEDHGVEFVAEPLALDKIIDKVLQSMKLVFEKHHASVAFEKEGDVFMMHGSLVHLTNVIYNLLDNALKYSPSSPVISIRLKDVDEKIILSLKDEGMGIPSEFQKKVFEKFFRVPSGDVHNIKGYGLGLNYVDNVIKSHKGKISIESEVGTGSTFTIILPKSEA
jgi:two-component system phosphate regulon sensor histidine kinase PhoR